MLVEKNKLSQAEAEHFVKLMFDLVNQSLLTDKIVKVKGLGTFKVTAVKDRESIDVNTGERILIEGRDRITFTPDNILKELVNKPFAQFETVVVNDGTDFSALDEKYAGMQDGLLQEEAVEEESVAEEPVVKRPFTTIAQKNVIESGETPNNEEEKEYERIIIPVDAAPAATGLEDVPKPHSHETIAAASQEKVASQEETATSHEMPVSQENVASQAEIPTSSVEAEEDSSFSADEEGEATDSRHVILPKSLVIGVLALIFILSGGLCWFAFHYGRLSAMQEQMAAQQAKEKAVAVKTPAIVKDSTKMKADTATAAMSEETPLAALQEEKRQAAEVTETSASTTKSAETSAANSQEAKSAAKPQETKPAVKSQEVKPQAAKSVSSANSSQYDADPRVRTGAYRIIGVAQTVTVRSGQSLRSISKAYLGPDMECYVEALNGTKEVKEGQKLKIPKLELKKKR